MTKGLILEVSARCRQEQCGVLALWCWERRSIFLRPRDFLAASFFVRGRPAGRVTPQGRASWCEGAVVARRQVRHELAWPRDAA